MKQYLKGKYLIDYKRVIFIQFSIFSVKDTLMCFFSYIGSFILCTIYDSFSILYILVVLFIGYFMTKLWWYWRSLPAAILNAITEAIPGYALKKVFEKEDEYYKKYYSKNNDSFNNNICIRGINIWLQEMFKFLSIFYLIYLV